ncbi:MAG: DNA alkylation repair protein [Candidatus Korobacteraceae bacterium]
MPKTPAYIAKHIRRVLLDGASAPHTEEVQRFFKHEIQSRGWYTGELRKVAVRFRRTILAEQDIPYLVEVADRLFRGDVLEEKIFAVGMLQGIVNDFVLSEFKLLENWLDRVSSWADHDALAHYLLGPMIAADAGLLSRPLRWAKTKSRWHKRAAAVSLIHSTRQHKNFEEIRRITEILLNSDDDMVQKGLGWLLREAAKFNPEQTVGYLMTIRERTPRLVLRTACETLPAAMREKLLDRPKARLAKVRAASAK